MKSSGKCAIIAMIDYPQTNRTTKNVETDKVI